MGNIRGDVISTLFKTGKAIGIGSHERKNAINALLFHSRCDVYKHNRRTYGLRRFALRKQRGHPAKRSADEHRFLPKVFEHLVEIRDVSVDHVVTLRTPLAIPVSAHIKRDSTPALLSLRFCCAAPGVPCLSSAV